MAPPTLQPEVEKPTPEKPEKTVTGKVKIIVKPPKVIPSQIPKVQVKDVFPPDTSEEEIQPPVVKVIPSTKRPDPVHFTKTISTKESVLEFCAPVMKRGLFWNWTLSGDTFSQACPQKRATGKKFSEQVSRTSLFELPSLICFPLQELQNGSVKVILPVLSPILLI